MTAEQVLQTIAGQKQQQISVYGWVDLDSEQY